MPGGEIVPVEEEKKPEKPKSALALALADQAKVYAKRYEKLDDDIVNDITDNDLTKRVKHKFSDDPNWMVDSIVGTCVIWVCILPPRDCCNIVTTAFRSQTFFARIPPLPLVPSEANLTRSK